MTADAKAVLREALALSSAERADVAAELPARLEPADDPETVRSLWAGKLGKRAREAISGESPGETWADVRQRLADELAG